MATFQTITGVNALEAAVVLGHHNLKEVKLLPVLIGTGVYMRYLTQEYLCFPCFSAQHMMSHGGLLERIAAGSVVLLDLVVDEGNPGCARCQTVLLEPRPYTPRKRT